MRIGEFAKKYDLTIDTIRHYMDIELLLPEKKGGHYFFGEKEEMNLKEILDLKALKFTLSEIQKIIGYSRLSQLRTKEDQKYIRAILWHKKNTLAEEERSIKNALEILNNKIQEIDCIDEVVEGKIGRTGIHISFMSYLNCPKCQTPLELEDGKITSNMVMEGTFKCSCGYGGNVENGIYISLDSEDEKNIQKGPVDPNVKPAATLGEYMDGTETSLINHIYKSIDAIISHIDLENLNHKIVLELGTGSGFFIKQFLSYLTPNSIYIVTDNDVGRIQYIKDYLEQHSPDCKFIYICADFMKLPIRNESMDYIVNYLTSLTYNFRNEQILDSIVIPKIKKGGNLIGCSYYVKSGSKLLKSVPSTSRRYFEGKSYKNEILNLGFNHIEMKDIGAIAINSKYEGMIKGHELSTLVYCGTK